MLYFCHVKILKRFISIVIWTVIAVNLLSAAILRLPSVQQFAGNKVSELLGDKLGTKVSVGRVDLGFLDRIIIDDVNIYDQQKKLMLTVSRMAVKIDYLPLANGRISISSAQLFGANARLYQKNAETPTNFQFVIDSLASKDTTSHTPLDLRINSLIIRRSGVIYDRLDVARTNQQLNPHHLRFSGISGHINLKALTDDSLHINVKRLSLHENSGLDINRLSFRLAAGRNQSTLSDFILQMPSSDLRLDSLKVYYSLDKKGLIAGTLRFSGAIKDAIITPSDLRSFEPALKNFQRGISLTANFNGTDEQVNIPELLIATKEKDIDISMEGWMANWQQQPAWHLNVQHLILSEASLDFLSKTFKLPDELKRIGNLQLTGLFDHNRLGETSLKSHVQSGIGDLDIQFGMNKSQRFQGDIVTENFNLGQVLNNQQLGMLSTQLKTEGLWRQSPQKPEIKVNGTIKQLDYNNYSYSNINLDGLYDKGIISGLFSIDDPNLSAHLNGEVSEIVFTPSAGKPGTIKLQGGIGHFSPEATHLSHTFGSSVFSADIDADIILSKLEDAEGSMRVSNFTMTATEEHPAYKLDNFSLSSGFSEGIHFISLKSDFADAELKGHFNYQTLAQSFVNLIGSRLPTLPGLPPIKKGPDNNFSLRLLMSKTDWLQRFFGINLKLQQPLNLTARLNDQTDDLALTGDLPSFAYNDVWYKNANIEISSPGDSLNCKASILKLMDDGQRMSISLNAQAASNSINTSLNWDNHDDEEKLSGELNTIIRLYKNLANKPEAHVRILPSHAILNNSQWDIEPSAILYSDKRLLVDEFDLHRGQQHIIIDGIASENPNDTMKVDLNEVEVDYILDLVNFHTVEFSGKATGIANVSSLFGRFAANADLRVDDFKFENGRMGTLQAKADWNQEAEQIDIHAIADDGEEAKTLINGYVSPVHETIDLEIDAQGTYLDFMHSFTKTFLSHITGHAEGDVRLAGTLDNINLTGNLVVDGEATVTALNTTYKLERDTLVMIPDEIELKHMTVLDKDGHRAYLSGGIHHEHLTNLSFDLYVDAENLLAYDFDDFGDSSFYGTVYASGNVGIHGHGNDVVIDCDVTPQKNSVFVYNAATPDAISKQEFIEWDNDEATDNQKKTDKNSSNRATETDIYINFLVNTTPDATLRLLMDKNTNDYITLNGEGSIRATFHNKGAFNMFGTYTVDHGTYGITIQNIIKKNFTFNRGGTIVFGGDPYQAALNLQAVYTVNSVSLSDLNIGNSFTNNTIRVNCLMNIGGQPAAPQVEFDLEMPTVNADEQQMVRSVINGQQEMNQQVVYLLAIGRFYNQGANNADEQKPDRTTLAMQSFLSGTLSTQINTLLNQIIKNDNWNFGANISTGNEGWHNAEYEGIISGRMFNNRLVLNGQFGYRDNATRANPSFIGDFDLQYLLYPSGNLALKVYNQTNDRYFTKSSLNTQGIGIIMKKDFNNLRDLFSSQKKKKKRTTETEKKQER